MITSTQILRMIDANDHSRLVDRLMTNGRCHSRVAREALWAAEAAAPSAIGLGLQRLCEIIYWPHPDGSALAHRLVRMQRRDGLFGPGEGSIAATAVALRGLIDWVGQHTHQSADAASEDRLAIIRKSIDRAWESLAHEWREAGPRSDNPRSDAARDTQWAIVLWQLGDCDEAREHLPVKEIRRSLASSSAAMMADDLSRLALSMAA